jgi:hypothetical protein
MSQGAEDRHQVGLLFWLAACQTHTPQTLSCARRRERGKQGVRVDVSDGADEARFGLGLLRWLVVSATYRPRVVVVDMTARVALTSLPAIPPFSTYHSGAVRRLPGTHAPSAQGGQTD